MKKLVTVIKLFISSLIMFHLPSSPRVFSTAGSLSILSAKIYIWWSKQTKRQHQSTRSIPRILIGRGLSTQVSWAHWHTARKIFWMGHSHMGHNFWPYGDQQDSREGKINNQLWPTQNTFLILFDHLFIKNLSTPFLVIFKHKKTKGGQQHVFRV